MKSYNGKKKLVLLLTISIILFIMPFYILPISAQATNEGPYWPTNNWVIVDPEEQGIDSNSISEMYAYIEENSLDVHSIIVVRNGYILTEEYLYNSIVRSEKKYGDDYSGQVIYNRTVHVQYSTSKSVTALLIGIALKEGYLTNINQTIYEFFSSVWDPAYNDKMNITIEQLLTHNSGLPSGLIGDHYIGNALNETLIFEPGTLGAFEYSGSGCNILAAIFNNVTGYNASEYARIKLFEPIGISEEEWYWWGDSNNISSGGAGFMCTPRVQAKLGILCLNNGTWNGTQIIPSDWIKEVTSHQVDGPMFYGQYGYLIYVDAEGGYHTYGAGGQSIYVVPKYNVTVAFTGFNLSTYYSRHDMIYRHMIDNFILQFITGSRESIPGFHVMIIILIAVVVISIYGEFLRDKIMNDNRLLKDIKILSFLCDKIIISQYFQ